MCRVPVRTSGADLGGGGGGGGGAPGARAPPFHSLAYERSINASPPLIACAHQ